MKRMHVHISVDDLAASIQFYENLYGQAATVRKRDYAKWVLEDPRVNFALSQRTTPGSAVSHLGIEVDNSGELEEYNSRLQSTGEFTGDIRPQMGANCCYARSDKYWATDPGGVTWEFFHTTGSSDTYGDDKRQAEC